MVSTRSAANASAVSSTRPTGNEGYFSRASGRAITGRTAMGLQDVGFGGVQGALDTEVGSQRVETCRQRRRVGARRQRDVEHHRVDRPGGLADDPSGEVEDV